MKLNLGCSSYLREGWINVDCRALPGVDQVVDLEKTPWPWPDNSADEIYASHVIEHLADPLAAMMEIHRVLKSGGVIHLRVPHANGVMAHALGHKSFFSAQWFFDLRGNPDMQNDTGRLFAESELKLHIRGFLCRQFWFLRAWEWLWNRTDGTKRAWECLGIVHPGEIEWTATK